MGELAGAYAGLIREMSLDRRQRDQQHAANVNSNEEQNRKLDQLLDLKPVVDEHGRWIESEGKPTARIVREGVAQARGATKGMIIGATLGGGAVGAFVVKIVAVLGSTFGHAP